MFSFLSKKEKSKTTLIIDIQSGLVRGALVIHKEKQSPVILKVHTKLIPRKIHTNSHYINKMMLKALSEVMALLTENHRVDSIVVILSSPWVLSHSKSIRTDFKNDTEINAEMLGKLVDEERNKLESKFIKINTTDQDIYKDLQYIEQKIFSIKLNGYEVTEYLGRKVKNIEISFAMTLSSKIIMNRIDNTIGKYTNCKNITYHSGLLLNFVALRKNFPSANDYVYMHVHSELTDIIIVKKGQCAHISSFPIGTSNLIRKISSNLRQNDDVTDSMISLYQGGKLDTAEANKLSVIIDDFANNWFSLYEKTLENSIEKTSTPRVFYISAHSHLDVFKSILVKLSKKEIDLVDMTLEGINSNITFDRNSETNQLVEMYAFALEDVL